MEVKINKEIREFKESIFFGLTMRQFIFSILACGVAIFLYFRLRSYLSIEVLSWVCILGAAPFAALGFIHYNGMTAEKLLIAFIKTKFLIPSKISSDFVENSNVNSSIHEKVHKVSNVKVNNNIKNSSNKVNSYPTVTRKTPGRKSYPVRKKRYTSKWERLIFSESLINKLENERRKKHVKNFK